MKIELGSTGSHRPARLDIDVLLRTRLLIQANSGKGKSWLLRRLAEQLFGKVQVIIIDPEGEFASLREKFGYVLVGKGGETPADPRSAALVAHKLLELRASAVCDLYEMRPSDRHEWVQRFLEAMIEAPKNLWHPCVVPVDEAHVYAPEKGSGESPASEAMISMGTRGRKRGYCIVAATQRLGKLRKDLAAELLNVMIGGTFIDIDRKRAADALGVYGPEQHKFFDEIKLLKRGNFYALGPAISDERVLIEVGSVDTSHPEAGSSKHASAPPPAPEEIARLLPKLADLPKAAEEKQKTEKELRAEIRSLKQSLRAAPAIKFAEPDTSAIVARALRPFRDLLGEAMKIIVKLEAFGNFAHLKDDELNALLNSVKREVKKLATDKLGAKERELASLKREAKALAARIEKLIETTEKRIHIDVAVGSPKTPDAEIQPKEKPLGERQGHAAATLARDTAARHPETNGDIPKPVKRVLAALAEFEAIGKNEVSRNTVASWLGVKAGTGSFKNYISQLRVGGYIEDKGAGNIALTDKGRESTPSVDRPTSTAALLDRAASVFGGTPATILRMVHREYPGAISRTYIANALGISAETGSFKNYISQLRVAGVIKDAPDRSLVASEWMFID